MDIYKNKFDYSKMNRLLYWVPLLNDNKVLINLNPEDEHYKKYVY
jgi:hypothetical protein